MIKLNTTARKLQIVLAGAITTNQLPCMVGYSDDNGTTYVGGSQLANTNSTTTVDICAAPAASTVRDIDYVNIRNRDTAVATVTVMLDDSATDYEIVKVTLAVGDQLVFTHGGGWSVLDVNGAVKTAGANLTGHVTSTGNAAVLGSFTMAQLNTAVSDANVAAAGANSDITSLTALSGNIAFTGTGNRITGDFSNGTVANRVLFQTSTANTFTKLGAVPSGSGSGAYLELLNTNSANSGATLLGCNVGESYLSADKEGTGTYLPMTFYTGGAERMRIASTGNVSIGYAGAAFYSEQLSVSNATPKFTMAHTGGYRWSMYVKTTDGELAFRYEEGGADSLCITRGNVVEQRAPAGLGYGTGAGGTVTQDTSKSTAVTLSKPTGQITMNNASLAANAEISFIVYNSPVAATDAIVVNTTGGWGDRYAVRADVSAGSFSVVLTNRTGSAWTDAVTINFAIIKGVAA